MALKTRFTDKEKFGLTEEEVKLGEKYLRKYKTAGAVKTQESAKHYERMMVGCSVDEIHQQWQE